MYVFDRHEGLGDTVVTLFADSIPFLMIVFVGQEKSVVRLAVYQQINSIFVELPQKLSISPYFPGSQRNSRVGDHHFWTYFGAGYSELHLMLHSLLLLRERSRKYSIQLS